MMSVDKVHAFYVTSSALVIVFAAALLPNLVTAESSHPEPVARMCSNGSQLANALLNPEVDVALLPNDVTLTDSDWPVSSAPIVLRRNFTIQGGNTSRPVSLNLGYVKHKIQLTNGTELVFQALAISQFRSGSFVATPGFDLLAPLPRDETARLLIKNCLIFFGVCFPPNVSGVNVTQQVMNSRPSDVPGTQLFIFPEPGGPPADCINDTRARLADQCYAYSALYADVAITSTDPGEGIPVIINGYLIWYLDTQSRCLNILTNDCINKLGPYACAYTARASYGKPSPPPPTMPPPYEGLAALQQLDLFEKAATKSHQGLSTQQTLTVVLSTVLGGLAVLAAVSGLVCWVIILRWRQRAAKVLGLEFGSNPSFHQLAPERDVILISASLQSNGKGARSSEQPDEWQQQQDQQPQDDRLKLTGTPSIESSIPSSCALRPRRAAFLSLDPVSTVVTPETPQRSDLCTNVHVVTGCHAGSAADGRSNDPERHVSNSAPTGNSTNGPESRLISDSSGVCNNGDGVTSAAAGPDMVTLLPVMLGKGACGRVYEGVYRGSRVAVKVILESAFDGLLRPPGHMQYAQRGQEQHQQEPDGRLEEVWQHPRSTDGGLSGTEDGGQEAGARVPDAPGEPLLEELQTQTQASLLQPFLSTAAAEVSQSAAHCSSITTDHLKPAATQPVASSEGQRQGVHHPSGTRKDKQPAEAALEKDGPSEGEAPAEGDVGDADSKDDAFCRRQLRQLAQEVEVLGRCSHPNVVRLLAACLTPPRLCLVMELMESSLERLIFSSSGSHSDSRSMSSNTLVSAVVIPLPKLLHIASQVAQGLAYLHPTITHRDLKPANVLLNGAETPTPVAKLTDFGLSRLRAATLPTLHPDAGTPAYMPPECYDLESNMVTHRADVYSFGILLWAMLTGRHPWAAHSIAAVAYKVAVLRERPPLDCLSRRRCPSKLRRLIQQCWDHDPLRRPAAAELVKQLALVIQQEELAVPLRGKLPSEIVMTRNTMHGQMTSDTKRPAVAAETCSEQQCSLPPTAKPADAVATAKVQGSSTENWTREDSTRSESCGCKVVPLNRAPPVTPELEAWWPAGVTAGSESHPSALRDTELLPPALRLCGPPAGMDRSGGEHACGANGHAGISRDSDTADAGGREPSPQLRQIVQPGATALQQQQQRCMFRRSSSGSSALSVNAQAVFERELEAMELDID